MNTEQDLKMMKDPASWPNFPTLCLKNYAERQEGGFPKFGVLVHRVDGTNVLIHEGVGASLTELAAAKKEEITAEKAIADGWIVD